MADEKQQEDPWKLSPDEDDLDELYSQDEDKDVVSEGDEAALEDNWETGLGHIPDIHTKRLNDIIAGGYPGNPNDRTRTGGITCPKALDLAWRLIKRGGRNWTKAKVQRMSVYHGTRIAYHDKDIKEIKRVYDKLMKISQLLDDDDLISTLADRKAYDFKDPQPKTTSMGTLKFLEGAISDLSDCLGVAKSNMYPLLSLLSIVTHEPPMWPTSLGKEYRSFRKAIEDRLEKLMKEHRRVVPEQNKRKNG